MLRSQQFKFAQRLVLLTIVVSALPCLAAHAADPRRDQVTAANAQALTELRRSVGGESIGDGFTVRDLIERTGTKKRFAESIARAQQIGGPRWLDDGATCQVKLELPAARVARTLVEIATLARLESPVPPEVLQGRLQQWGNRTFSATGTSTGAAAVGEGPRGKGVCDARDAAVQQTLDAIRPVQLADGKTVGDALAQTEVGQRIEEWLTARPITQIEFSDVNQATVSLAVQPDELFDTFRVATGAAVVKNQPVALPKDEAEWQRVHNEFTARVTSAVTRGVSTGKQAAPADPNAAPPVAIKHAAVFPAGGAVPDWANRTIEAEGRGTATGSQLKAARAAEADAGNKLRAKLDPLPLAGGMTISQAVANDPTLENALDRALVRARTSHVDYQGRDTATVKVQLDLREVWREIESAR